jgi:hypothetical protein
MAWFTRLILILGENNLSFIETSALDASNVELAFQNILTGTFPPLYFFHCPSIGASRVGR